MRIHVYIDVASPGDAARRTYSTVPPVGSVDIVSAEVLHAGPREAFDEHRPAQSALGGDADLVGEQVGLAAAYDLGTGS